MAKKDRVVAKTLKGFRDFAPELAAQRKSLVDQIWANAAKSGFDAIETPVLEYAETLLGSGGEEADKEVYLFDDHGGRRVGLRFDLTVPFSRFVAQNQGTLAMPFKRVQIGNSYRGEKPQKGRYREFCQADVDIVGVDSLGADVEVIQHIVNNLNDFIPSSFSMLIGHRVVLSSLISTCLPNISEDGELKTLIALDKLAKVGEDKVAELISEVDGSDDAGIQKLLATVTAKDAAGDTDLSKVRDVLKDTDSSGELDRLEETMTLLKELVSSEKAVIKLDLSIARGLGYYTGIVFETFIDALPNFGSVSSGGRYNGLVSRFSKQEVPGIGGSIGVDRLLAALEELGVKSESSREGVFIAIATEEARSYGFKMAKILRDAGIKADLALKKGKLGQQFKYADRRNFKTVITLGDDELANQCFSMKELETGTEDKLIPMAQLLERLN